MSILDFIKKKATGYPGIENIQLNDQQPRTDEALLEDVKYALQIGKGYLRWLPQGSPSLDGKVVLEIGPGKNFGSALYLTCFGARAVIADAFLAPWDEEYHPRLYMLMRDAILQDSPHQDITPFDRILSYHGYDPDIVKPVRTSLEDLEGIPSAGVDFIFSNAALEHVYDPRRAFESLARVTRPGGAGFHQIDFRDHRSFNAPLEFLLLKDTEIGVLGREAYREPGNLWQPYDYELGNRWRPYEYKALFEGVGFEVTEIFEGLFADKKYLESFIPRLRAAVGSRYKNCDEKYLSLIAALFKVRKPG